MEIRTEIHQGILDARLLEIDIISFLNNKAEWGDSCPLTNFKTKHSIYGYRAIIFQSGQTFIPRMSLIISYIMKFSLLRRRLLYVRNYRIGCLVVRPQSKFYHLRLSLRILEEINKFVSPLSPRYYNYMEVILWIRVLVHSTL